MDTRKAIRYMSEVKVAAKDGQDAADAVREELSRLSAESARPSPAEDTEKARAVAEEARRLRGIADKLFR